LHLHTCVYTVCTIFILLLPSLPPHTLQCQPHPLESFHTPVLWFYRTENTKER
jgi:hypothetical protein